MQGELSIEDLGMRSKRKKKKKKKKKKMTTATDSRPGMPKTRWVKLRKIRVNWTRGKGICE
eukprot:9271847-Pyramimonas_sp.AAC.1